MKQIEIQNGYMVCVECRGFVEAGNLSPSCECLPDDATRSQELPQHLN